MERERRKKVDMGCFLKRNFAFLLFIPPFALTDQTRLSQQFDHGVCQTDFRQPSERKKSRELPSRTAATSRRKEFEAKEGGGWLAGDGIEKIFNLGLKGFFYFIKRSSGQGRKRNKPGKITKLHAVPLSKQAALSASFLRDCFYQWSQIMPSQVRVFLSAFFLSFFHCSKK